MTKTVYINCLLLVLLYLVYIYIIHTIFLMWLIRHLEDRKMSSALDQLNKNYELVKTEHGVTDTRYCIGEIKDCTPEQFAVGANIVLEAYISNKVSPLSFNDSQT